MLGRTRREIERDVDEDFPYLPAGCQVRLDPVAKKIVLDNIRTALPTRWPERVRELRELGDVSLPTYLHETGLERDDIYQGGHSLTEMRRGAGILTTAASWKAAGEQVAIATVVETWGSSPRPAGSRLAITMSGRMEGSVSGGCIEGAVAEAAMQTIRNGAPQLLDFGVTNERAWEVGLACGGKVKVFVEPLV